MTDTDVDDIAVIGMACTFPRATTPDRFWRNLCDGVETIRSLPDEELLAKGVPAADLADPDYVKVVSTLDDVATFDAEFFGINAAEARLTDPQHRIFLECCWTALEDAGHDPARFEGDIGVFGGLGLNSYLLEVLAHDPGLRSTPDAEQILIGNDKDFLTSRVSYKLNLTGPSVNVNTACSTSLVAVHLARQSLLSGECDMALAGGVSVIAAGDRGYRYVKDGIRSPDGHCRAFDARARGTVWGDGGGVVVLKRLSRALDDGDHLYATIKGSAVNNDGSAKVGYTAPSVDGQVRVVAEALAEAAVSPDEIGYVEAHGTGTQLGDPIEVAALTEAFRSGTRRTGYCAIGSVKTNIGHLNAAAGIAGFIKTVLVLQHGQLPPSLNFTEPNPEIDFAASPFRVQTALADWPAGPAPRRAGVSSLGIGGTNCHLILQEPPAADPARPDGDREHHLLLSARSPAALAALADNLARHLEAHPELPLADIAYTLQCGRRHFRYRRAVTATSTSAAAAILSGGDPATPPDGGRPARLARWLDGADVDWEDVWSGSAARRVPLPTYPFERRRYWYEPSADGDGAGPEDFAKLPDPADWFSAAVWRQVPRHHTPLPHQPRAHLVFLDALGVGDAVALHLASVGQEVTTVATGERRGQRGTAFVVDPARADDYVWLFETLRDQDRMPDEILFLWPLRPVDGPRHDLAEDSFVDAQRTSALAILHLGRALERLTPPRPVRLTAVTNDVYDITGAEALNVHGGTVAGACLVLQQTYGNVTGRVLDLSLSTPATAGTAARQALEEIGAPPAGFVTAARGGHRYVREYARMPVQPPDRPLIRPGRPYLMCGCLEGVGHLVAEHITRGGGTVLLLEDAAFPERGAWADWLAGHDEADPTSARIRRAERLVARGAEYLGRLSARPEDNRRLLADAERRHGPIAGAVHAPGAANAKRISTLPSVTVDDWRGHFGAIAHSFVLLDDMLSDRTLDLRVVIGSLAAALGGDGFFHIATISGFVTSYAAARARAAQPWTVHCQDSWFVEWNGFLPDLPAAFRERVRPVILTNDEGLRSFERALTVTRETALYISARDFGQRYHAWVTSTAVPATSGPRHHPRPELDSAYVAPRTPLEHQVADVVARLLGVARVGVHDDFFALGGHSLLGVRLASELRELRPVDIGLSSVYRFPTVAELVAHLEGGA